MAGVYQMTNGAELRVGGMNEVTNEPMTGDSAPRAVLISEKHWLAGAASSTHETANGL